VDATANMRLSDLSFFVYCILAELFESRGFRDTLEGLRLQWRI